MQIAMIHLPDSINLWLMHYGSISLFLLLFLGGLFLPVPQNALVVVAGMLVSQGKLFILPAFLASFLGVTISVTITYLIGKTAGVFLLETYGSYLGITHARLQKVNQWYERIGKWTLFIGYYLPIVRRLMGYAAGIGQLSFRHFALFAYVGALIWVSLFLSIGYIIGHQL